MHGARIEVRDVGHVRSWPKADMDHYTAHACFWG